MSAGSGSTGFGDKWVGRLQRVWERDGAVSKALRPFAWLFGIGAAARRKLYRHGWCTTHALPVPVIVVGNLIVGGAGKTPAVLAIIALLRAHGWKPGIVSRGYGRARENEIVEVTSATDARDSGDEPLLLARRTGVPVVVGGDRVAAGHALLQSHPEVDVLVSDDGLQHLSLGRDVEVLIFDERGIGNGRLLPAGPLREDVREGTDAGPFETAAAARRIVVYNAAEPTTSLPGFIGRRSLAGVVPLADWWNAVAPSPDALAGLRDRNLVAAAGLARPGRFFAMLRAAGLSIVELPLPDHYDFSALPWPLGTGDVVVTEKDAVKLAPDRRIGARVWVAALDFEIDAGFTDALLSRLPPRAATPSTEPDGNPPA